MAFEDFILFCRETGILGEQGPLTEAAVVKCFT